MVGFYKRVAVRDGDNQPWRWFRPPIPFRLLGYKDSVYGPPIVVDDDEAYAQLEDQLAEAVFYRPTSYIRVFQTRLLSDFDALDLNAIQ